MNDQLNDQSAMDFEQLGIGEVLSRYRLVVPPNQRDYAWEAEQVKTLFEDIALAIANDESNYFLGTIVTVPISDGVLEVIDGQQRLATTSLALAALKSVSHANDPRLSRALDEFLTNSDPETLELTPKLRLNTADNSVFHSLITEGKLGDGFVSARLSHQNLDIAFSESKLHWKTISKPLNENDQGVVLKKWMNFIRFKAKIILLKVPSTVNAYKMFETLNDRGVKSTQADLIKNHILGESGENLNQSQEIWGYIKGSLESVSEDDITVNFLRQAIICQYGWVKEANVYEKVQQTVRGPESARKFLTEIEVQARDYAAILNPSSDKWNAYSTQTRRSLEVLNLLNVKPFRSLLLAIAQKFSPKEAASAFKGLVSLGVRMLIATSTRSGTVEQTTGKSANQIYLGKISDAKAMFEQLSTLFPTDELFKQKFEVATVSNTKFARYYLRTIENAYKEEPEPWLIPNDDAQAITLEHVLPIKPMGNWPEFDEDQVKLYSKRIGNLVLLQASTNSMVGSKPFAEKAEHLKNSPYGTTVMVGDAPSWNPAAISSRQRVLAELASSAWPNPF